MASLHLTPASEVNSLQASESAACNQPIHPGFGSSDRRMMASLVVKDSYIQSLAKKVCAQKNEEPRKRRLALKTDGSEEFMQPKKKKKPRKRSEKMKLLHDLPLPSNTPQARLASERQVESDSFFAVDLLRERLHEKIQEAHGQSTSKGLSPEELEKRRQRRKQERERKKRKRKKLRVGLEKCDEPETSRALELPCEKKNAAQGSDQALLIFNKVEVHDQKELNQAVKEKKQNLKGKLTPLTGKNFKQLLSRLEARQSKLEDLKAKDEKRAQELENKMKWTNVLYKAEGVKIKDNEELLKAALKRKEKRQTQRQKQWEKRTEQTVDKMQQRQAKRKRNIQKKKRNKMERKMERARKKGRILPQDLK